MANALYFSFVINTHLLACNVNKNSGRPVLGDLPTPTWSWTGLAVGWPGHKVILYESLVKS
jgi:hypothetical protein